MRVYFQIGKASLFRSDAFQFFIGLNEMTAVGESGFLTDIIQIVVGKEQHIVCFADFDEFYVFLAGLSIQKLKIFGKVRVTHTALLCQFFNAQQLVRVFIDVFGNVI